MSTFFQGQMDYIFFFYGLAFIGLGVVCLHPLQRGQPAASLGLAGPLRLHPRGQRMAGPGGPVLGGRGVVCGPALGHHDRVFPLPGGIRPSQPDPKAGPGTGALASRRFGPGRRPGGPRWLKRLERHHPLLPGSGGQPGGRVGILFAEGRKAEPRCRPWLLAGGVGFILYGLATGVVVPQAGFWPAAAVNYETFTSLTGLPIQLVRGLLALWIAAHDHGLFSGGVARGL